MIFDFTDLGAGVNVRHRPKNHITVTGSLYHGSAQIASLQTLALIYSNQEYGLAGGRFTLAWHKLRGPITAPIRLVVEIDDDRLANYSPLQDGTGRWIIDDLQILFEGSPIAIGHFNELLGKDVPFFGKRVASHQLTELA